MKAQDSQPVPPTEVCDEPDGSTTEYYDLPITSPTWDLPSDKVVRLEMLGRKPEELGSLLGILQELFVDNWNRIRFGPCIQGAVYELEFREQPSEISFLDGYLTVVMPPGPAHFHLCIGEHRGLGHHQTPRRLAKARRCSRAALYRSLGHGTCSPQSWGLRLWNGAGEQMLTVFLPSPFLDDQLKRIEPDWSRLSLWNSLREKYLCETVPQPLPDGRATVPHG